MKLALSWLEDYFDQKPNWDLIFERLTMAGLEIEGIDVIAPDFSGVVVAQVVEFFKHPNADKLNICKVDVGLPELLQIVCGASNVAVGIKVPCALVGGILPNGLEIKEREMRGVTSFGMLCGGGEIGIPDSINDGLLLLSKDAPIGVSVRDYLGLDDKIVEFKITPNRGDCLSVQGILREIGALTPYKPEMFIDTNIDLVLFDELSVVVEQKDVCSNYLALVIKGVDNQVKLPECILNRLRHSSIQSISPVVDIANYVMLELGQPLHVFDLACIGRGVCVRYAHDGEILKLLTGLEVTLTKNTLIVCDSQNKPITIAGIMGGEESGVKDLTSDIMLESAFFSPFVVAGIAKYYGISSEAAYRYERGVDPQLQQMAICYVAKMIVKYCGGAIGGFKQSSHHNDNIMQPHIVLKRAQVTNVLGVEITHNEINEILKALNFKILENHDDIFTVQAPSFRFDIKIAEDVIEEIARVYGYDKIKPVMPVSMHSINMLDKYQMRLNVIKQQLTEMGYAEIISYAFIEEKFEQLLGNPTIKSVKLKNPIAGLSVMRTSLIADLVKAFIYNVNRGHDSIRLFECARVFYGEDEATQPMKIAGLIYGNAFVDGWTNQKCEVDFYDLKRDVEAILGFIDQVHFKPCLEYVSLHSGRCAKIYSGLDEIGIIGQIHPSLAQEVGNNKLPYVFELDLNSIYLKHKNLTVKEPLKFQKVERDLAFILSDQVNVGDIILAIRNLTIPDLISINVFDVYYGEELAIGFKSVAIKFVFHANKTFTDIEINEKISKIISFITDKFEAKLRQ